MAMPFEQAPEAFHPVERPKHYAFGGIEAIEGIEASMSTEAYRGFCKGNVLKYVWRYESKNGLEDLEKAKWYLNQLIFALETDQEREALAAIENNVDNGCKDGFCPIPGIRYDLPGKQVLFDPVDKA
jgi:hypothetical protein